jgi:polyisoprenoid-binding protein YceI
MARYRLDPKMSRFTVQAFATGLLSFRGHSPTFAVRDFVGIVDLEGSPVQNVQLEVTVQADSLELLDNVKPADRREIETTMRTEVLEAATYPAIEYRADDVAFGRIEAGRYRLRITGQLTLHGFTRPQQIGAELVVFSDGIRLRGGAELQLSDYRIRPVTALGGTIKLKDDLRVTFDIAGRPEAT